MHGKKFFFWFIIPIIRKLNKREIKLDDVSVEELNYVEDLFRYEKVICKSIFRS